MKKSYQKIRDLDLDPLSTTVVQDLLDADSQWRGVADIIKLSIKALTDIVRVQGASVKQINNALPTRASKNELSTGLSLKANVNDVSRTINEVSNLLQSKISLNEMHDVMKEYVTRQYFNERLLSQGNNHGTLMISKLTSGTSVDSKIDEFQRHFEKKMAGYVTLNQFQQLLSIVEQKPNINQVNEILQNKVSKPVFNAALQKLVARSQMQLAYSKKADITDLEYIVSTLETKVDLSTIEKLTQVIQNKIDKSDIDVLISKTDQIPQMILQSIEQLKRDLEKVGDDRQIPLKKIQHLQDRFSDLNSSLHSKISHSQTSAIITNIKYQLNEQIAKMKMHIRNHLNQDQNKTIELFSAKELLKQVSTWKRDKQVISKQIDGLATKIDQNKSFEQSSNNLHLIRKQIEQWRNQLSLEMEQKLSADELEQVLAKWVEQIHVKIGEDREDILQIIKEIQQDLKSNLSEHTFQIKQINSITKKNLHEQNSQELTRRVRRQIDDMRKTVDKIYVQVQGKLCQSQYESDLIDLRKRIESISKQLSSKSNIKDVCVLIDSKPNVEEINKALKQIHEQLEVKVSSEQLRAILQDQATINQTLCQQNIIGRWLWHSGQIRAGNLVPWQGQTVNTLPNNFLWDKDQTSILVLASGLYEITANIFSKYPTVISLLINGQSTIIAKHSSNDKQNINGNKKKKSKQTISSKIHEYFMLPTRARISLSCSGEPGSQGFLSIKRL